MHEVLHTAWVAGSKILHISEVTAKPYIWRYQDKHTLSLVYEEAGMIDML